MISIFSFYAFVMFREFHIFLDALADYKYQPTSQLLELALLHCRYWHTCSKTTGRHFWCLNSVFVTLQHRLRVPTNCYSVM